MQKPLKCAGLLRNTKEPYDLPDGYAKLDDVKMVTGKLNALHKTTKQSLAICKRLAKVGASNTAWHTILFVAVTR
jgi:hypothetical protein